MPFIWNEVNQSNWKENSTKTIAIILVTSFGNKTSLEPLKKASQWPGVCHYQQEELVKVVLVRMATAATANHFNWSKIFNQIFKSNKMGISVETLLSFGSLSFNISSAPTCESSARSVLNVLRFSMYLSVFIWRVTKGLAAWPSNKSSSTSMGFDYGVQSNMHGGYFRISVHSVSRHCKMYSGCRVDEPSRKNNHASN